MKDLSLIIHVLFCFLALCLSGCVGLNSVVRLEKGGTPNIGQSVVIYGIRVENQWRAPKFAVNLDKFNVDEQALAGNCWRHDRTIATVPGVPGPTQYFSFEVPPGHYVYGSWGAAPLRGGALEFDAPVDKVVFIGEFVYTEANDVELHRNLERAMPSIVSVLPETPKDILLAKATFVTNIQGFLCMP